MVVYFGKLFKRLEIGWTGMWYGCAQNNCERVSFSYNYVYEYKKGLCLRVFIWGESWSWRKAKGCAHNWYCVHYIYCTDERYGGSGRTWRELHVVACSRSVGSRGGGLLCLLDRKDLSPMLQLSVRFRPSPSYCVCSSVSCAFPQHSSATSANKTVLLSWTRIFLFWMNVSNSSLRNQWLQFIDSF